MDLDEALVAEELSLIYQDLDGLHEEKKRLVANTQKSIQMATKKISSLLGQNQDLSDCLHEIVNFVLNCSRNQVERDVYKFE